MTLYKADFLALHGEAVKSTKPKKGKKEDSVETVEEEERPTTGGKQLPVKPPKTEKQLAALERARENRKRKRMEAEEAELKTVEDAKKAVEAKEQEIAQKKAEQKEKRRLKKEAREKQEATPSTDGISEAVEEMVSEKPKKDVKIRQPKKAKVVNESIDDPPAWFKKYIEGHEIEKNMLSKEKRPVQVIKKESKQVASDAWADDMTRDRVNQERDNHMSRMYASIFGSKLR